MSRKPVKTDTRALDDLPLFRTPIEPEPAAVAAADEEPEAFAEGAAEAVPEAATDDADVLETVAMEDVGEALESLDDAEPAPAAAPTPRSRPSPVAEMPAAPLHGVWCGVGIALALVGLALAIAAGGRPPLLSGLLEAMARLGMSPGLLLAGGGSLWGIGVLLGRQGRQAAALARVESTLHDLLGVADQVEATTRALHDTDAARAATAMSGDEIGQVLFALQRNEEKLTNLTRATKTFGKPLVEITSQMAEATSLAAQSQTMIQALRVASENGLNKVEEEMRKLAEPKPLPQLAELQHAVEDLRTAVPGRLDAAVKELKSGPDALVRHLQTLGTTLETALAGTGQRVRDSVEALGKDLSGTTHRLRDNVDALGKDLALTAQRLHAGLEALGKDLAGKLAAAHGGSRETSVDLTPVHNALADVRRELANLARAGSTRAAPAAPAAPATPPAPAAPAAAAPPPPAAPAAATPAAPASAAPAEPNPASGLAHSIAGARSSKGSNVLGAIAKLKKMRS
jgi:hypothetical protein